MFKMIWLLFPLFSIILGDDFGSFFTRSSEKANSSVTGCQAQSQGFRHAGARRMAVAHLSRRSRSVNCLFPTIWGLSGRAANKY